MSDLSLEAHRLAVADCHVLPLHGIGKRGCTCGRKCPSPGKHPRLPNGLHDASGDPQQVLTWWSRWPNANIGIRTGHVGRGLFVIDVDGAEGEETLLELQRRYGRLPETRWARTGSGGWHAYFAMPDVALGNSTGKLGPHVDTRGDDGYVVAPPSRHHTGGTYAWHNRTPVADLPAWVVGLLRPPPPVVRPVRLRGNVDNYAAAALAAECREVETAVPGTRNHALNAAAFAIGSLVGAGRLQESTARLSLLAAALTCGLGEVEAERTIASGLTAGARHPREVVA